MIRRALVAAAVIGPPLLVWILLFAVVPFQQQNFPLNDDGAYSLGLFTLLDHGTVEYFKWTAMPLLGQWAWATPFTWMLGQNFAAIRVSTIVLSLLASIAFYVLLRREAQLTRTHAVLGCALLSLNPLFLMLSGTFMTDIPALSFSLIALALLTVAVQRQSWPMLCAGAIPALAAVTSRQNALAVAGVVLYLAWRRAAGMFRIGVAVLAFALAGAGLLAVWWFSFQSGAFVYPPQVPKPDILVRLVAGLSGYLGLFVLPIAILGWRRGLVPLNALLAALALTVGWLLYVRGVYHYFFSEALFPQLGNLITVEGTFGKPYMSGTRPAFLSLGMRAVLTMLSVVGVAWLVAQAMRRWRERSAPNALDVFAVCHLPFLFIAFTMFDRYMLVFLPAAIGLALWRLPEGSPPARRAVAAACAGVMVAGSIGLTHDWLAWNAARWQLGRSALASGIAASEIEGGFEWNQLHALQDRRIGPESGPPQGLTMEYHATLFNGISGRCAISFSPLPDTRVVSAATYAAWLGFEHREMLLVCRP
ncbi:MAG TPA: glycosyltransferase family 39 protein [Vicinamibacterales bacterium]|nr:glycosyltransferase family 39 protein [Vicinamibacterales bacterium]